MLPIVRFMNNNSLRRRPPRTHCGALRGRCAERFDTFMGRRPIRAIVKDEAGGGNWTYELGASRDEGSTRQATNLHI